MDITLRLLLATVFYAFPVVLIGGVAWALFKRTAIAKAILAQAGDRELVTDVASAVSRLQDEVAELQSRLDYAEHRLAQPGGREPLPPLSGRPRTPPESTAAAR